MYHHVKKLMYTVRVDEPDPRFGNMLLEQFGGANGELAAAMQYSVQGINCDDPGRKDMLMDIGTEELSHLEIVGTLARMHLKPLKSVREQAEVDPLIAIAGGGGVNLFNSMGNAWTADYLKITGELDVDLRSNIAAEARAKIVYERLINFCRDAGGRALNRSSRCRWRTRCSSSCTPVPTGCYSTCVPQSRVGIRCGTQSSPRFVCVWTISQRGDDAPPSPDPFTPNASTASSTQSICRAWARRTDEHASQKLAFRSCVRVHKVG